MGCWPLYWQGWRGMTHTLLAFKQAFADSRGTVKGPKYQMYYSMFLSYLSIPCQHYPSCLTFSDTALPSLVSSLLLPRDLDFIFHRKPFHSLLPARLLFAYDIWVLWMLMHSSFSSPSPNLTLQTVSIPILHCSSSLDSCCSMTTSPTTYSFLLPYLPFLCFNT